MSITSKIVGVVKAMFGLSRTSSTAISIGTSADTVTIAGTPTITASNFSIGSVTNDGTRWQIQTSQGLLLSSAYPIVWSDSSAYTSTKDIGLIRNAAGTLRVTDASTGYGWLMTAGFAFLASPGTNTTITPATTGLSVTLVAGRKYNFRLKLYTTNVTAADGLRVDFDGGTATMTTFIQNGIVTDTAGVRSLPQTTAIATDVTDTTTTGAAMSIFEGSMVVNAGGTFIPRYAKEADAAGATITIQAGSTLEVWEMP